MKDEKIKKEYNKHHFEFEKWNIGILARFLEELEQEKWKVDNREVTVKTDETIVENINNKYSTHTPDTLDFFYKWGMYQKASIAYEDRTDEK